MKKQFKFLLPLLVIVIVSVFCLTACDTTVKVTFEGGAGATGTAPAAMEKNQGETITLPDNTFVKDGFEFVGWSDGTATYKEGATYTLAGGGTAVVFTAVWQEILEPEEYDFAYAAGEHGTGNAPSSVKKQAGDKITLAAADTFTAAEGYDFAGWSDGTTVHQAGAEFTMPAANVTLTATWSKISYTLNYASGEHGTGAAPAEISKNFGDKIILGAADTFTASTGYTFAGWSDGTTVYQAGAEFTMPAANITLTAQWEKADFTVNYAAGQHGTGAAPAEISKNFGDKITLVAADTFTASTGYTFAGWSDGTTVYQAGAEYTMPAANVIFTAQWQKTAIQGKWAQGGNILTVTSAEISDGYDTYLFGLYNDMPGCVTISGATGQFMSFDFNTVLTLALEDGILKVTPYQTTATADYTDNGGVTASSDFSAFHGVYKVGDNKALVVNEGQALFYDAMKTTFSARVTNTFDTLFTVDGDLYGVAQDGDYNWVMLKFNAAENAGGVTVYPYGEDISETAFSSVEEKDGIVKFTASFRKNGSSVNYIQFVFKGETAVAENADVGNNYYRFDNKWVVSGTETEFVFTSPVTEDITVSAVYTRLYSVSYAKGNNQAQGTVPSAEYFAEGEKTTVKENAFTLENHTFQGWSDGTNVYQPSAEYTVPAANVTLTAVWKVNAYTVVFQAGNQYADGTNPETVVLSAQNNTLTLPDNPYSNEYYVFKGWTDGTTTYQPGETLTVTEEGAVISGVWAELVTVTFKNGVVTFYTATVEKGGTVEMPETTPVSAGKTFGFWSKAMSANSTSEYDFSQPVEEDMNLYAAFGYKVFFDLNGGTGETVSEFVVWLYNGQVITMPAEDAVAKENRTPAYWMWGINKVNCGETYTFTKIISSDITFKLMWNVAVTFDPNNGEETFTVSVLENAKAAKPAENPSKQGVTFMYWAYGEDDEEYDFNTSVAAPVTLKAVYGITVTFDPNNGGGTTTALAAEGKPVAKPSEDPELTGKVFRYWALDGSEYDFSTPVTSEIELSAVYGYSVGYNAGGAEGTLPENSVVGSYVFVTLPAADGLTKEGFAFAGWLCSADNEIYKTGERYRVSSAVTFTAVWEEVQTGFAVTFEKGYWAATGDVPTMENQAAGAVFALPSNGTLARDGYTFGGWKCDIDNKVYQAGDEYTMTAAATKFTAQWTEITYALTYAAGEHGSGDAPAVKNVASGKTVYLASADTFTAEQNYVFNGWLCSIDGELYAAGDPYRMTAANTVFTAQWIKLADTQLFVGVWTNGSDSVTVTSDCKVVINGKYVAVMEGEASVRFVYNDDYTVYGSLTYDEGTLTYADLIAETTVVFSSKTDVISLDAAAVAGSYVRDGAGTVLTISAESVTLGTVKYNMSVLGQYVYLEHASNSGYYFVLTVTDAGLAGYANGSTACAFTKNITYTVTYKAGEGMMGEDVVLTVSENEVINLAANPFAEKFGFMFVNWITEDTQTEYDEGAAFTVTADVVFVADYMTAVYEYYNDAPSDKANYLCVMVSGAKYTGDFELNMFMLFDGPCGDGLDPNLVASYEFDYEYNQQTGEFVITILDEEGLPTSQTFTGWMINEDLSIVITLDGIDYVFGNYIALTYKAGDGVESASETVYVVKNETAVLKGADAFTAPDNHLFAGWKIEGTDTVLDAGQTHVFTADTVLIAQWQEISGYAAFNIAGGNVAAETAYIYLDGQGGGEFVFDVTDETGDSAIALTYTLQGSVIEITVGGGTEFAGTFMGTLLTVEITYNGKVYSFGEAAPSAAPTVTFEGGQGTGTAPADVEVIYDQANDNYYVVLPANTFTAPVGFTFKAWSDGANEFAAGGKYVMQAGEEVVFTAVFESAAEFVTETIEGALTLTKYNGEAIAVVIPAELGIEVIAKGAFSGKTAVTSIDIPQSVKTIKSGAFTTCTALQYIILRSETPVSGMGCWGSNALSAPLGIGRKLTIYVPAALITTDPTDGEKSYGPANEDWTEQTYVIEDIAGIEASAYVRIDDATFTGVFVTETPISVTTATETYTYAKMTLEYHTTLQVLRIKVTYIPASTGAESTPITPQFTTYTINEDNTYSWDKNGGGSYKMTVGFTADGKIEVLAFTYNNIAASNVSTSSPIVFTKQS